MIVIRAISAGVKTPLRTPEAKAYDGLTLMQLAQRIARRRKLKLVGKIEHINLQRMTQIHEHDLAFLRRVADEYGYSFTVKGEKLVFFNRGKLYEAEAIFTLRRTDLTSYRMRDKIMGVPRSAVVSSHDPKTKKLNHYKVENTGRRTSADVIKLNYRAESEQQAKAKAQAALVKANSEATTLSLTLFGNPKAVAGISFRLEDMGKFGGLWHIVESRHEISRGSGYVTMIEAKRVSL